MSFRLQSLERRLINLLPVSLQKRLAAADSNNRAIMRSMIWLSVFVFGAKIVAAFKEVVIAWGYGTSEILDGYLLIFNLASWPISIFGVVSGFILVPQLVRLRQQASANEFRRWQRQITTWVWLIAILITFLSALALEYTLETGWLGLSPTGQSAAKETLPWMALMVGFGIISSWHACQLMSAQRHTNTFFEAMPSLALLIAVLLWPASNTHPLLWGTIVGFAAQFLLIALAVKAAGMPVGLSKPLEHVLTKSMRSAAYWLLAAQVLLGFAGVIDQIILAHLSPGSLAAFSYANRVMAMVLSLTALVLNRALLPILSGISNVDEAYKIASNWARRVIWAGIIAAILIILLAHLGIELLFERGAFTKQDTHEVAILLILMSVQLPLFLGVSVWVQWLLTRPGHGQAMWWAAIASIIFKFSVIACLIILLDWGAAAVALGLTASSIGYFWIIQRFIKRDRQQVLNLDS